MNKFFGGIKSFLLDTVAELHKCSWPSRGELFESTVLVIVVIVILSTFVAIFDQASLYLVKIITGS